ncbi:MAG: hypothetical protein KGH66_02620 [Candidatus Micrarchaeota archaeon]|nr:hypothetical protein [Candidatus Micrarchaeota archaeon]
MSDVMKRHDVRSPMVNGHSRNFNYYRHLLKGGANSIPFKGEPRELSTPNVTVEKMAVILVSLYTSGILPRSNGHNSAVNKK